MVGGVQLSEDLVVHFKRSVQVKTGGAFSS